MIDVDVRTRAIAVLKTRGPFGDEVDDSRNASINEGETIPRASVWTEPVADVIQDRNGVVFLRTIKLVIRGYTRAEVATDDSVIEVDAANATIAESLCELTLAALFCQDMVANREPSFGDMTRTLWAGKQGNKVYCGFAISIEVTTRVAYPLDTSIDTSPVTAVTTHGIDTKMIAEIVTP